MSFIFVINFVPNKIQTCSAPQNDFLNLGFVKAIHMVEKKMTRNGRKTANYHSQILGITLYSQIHENATLTSNKEIKWKITFILSIKKIY
jgi:hypothetical protein